MTEMTMLTNRYHCGKLSACSAGTVLDCFSLFSLTEYYSIIQNQPSYGANMYQPNTCDRIPCIVSAQSLPNTYEIMKPPEKLRPIHLQLNTRIPVHVYRNISPKLNWANWVEKHPQHPLLGGTQCRRRRSKSKYLPKSQHIGNAMAFYH